MSITSIILAAGKGTRMKSNKVKVLHELCHKPLLHYPVKLCTDIGSKKVIAVVGHQEEEIRERFKDYEGIVFASQMEQLGTGHAVLCAFDKLDDADDDILILCGDSPLLKADTIRALHDGHTGNNASVSILTAVTDRPAGYGRIVKDTSGRLSGIVEEKDASDEIKMINEVNTGTYIVKKDFLYDSLNKVTDDNAQKEFYLTDIVSIAVSEGEKVVTYCMEEFYTAMGINTREELAKAGRLKQLEINKTYMSSGVTIIDPDNTYIEEGMEIETDVVIYPGVSISGDTTIKEGATIRNGCVISGSKIGRGAEILPYCVIEKSVIEDDVKVGPFARLRPDAVLKKGAKIGNFVEIKKSTVGEGSKAGHLTYLGDTVIGKDVNIGAGTITCNYDGEKKHQTVIEDNVFIGSNTSLVAPVTIEENALVGAGAVITKDVPKGMTAVERSRQKHYIRKKKED